MNEVSNLNERVSDECNSVIDKIIKVYVRKLMQKEIKIMNNFYNK